MQNAPPPDPFGRRGSWRVHFKKYPHQLCEHVSWFLIKVDLVENEGAGRFVKTSLKLHSNNAQML